MKWDLNTLINALVTGAGATAGIVWVLPYVETFPVMSWAMGAFSIGKVVVAGAGITAGKLLLEKIRS